MNNDTEIRELTLRAPQQLAILDGALSIQQLLQQRSLIEQAMKAAMKEGQHYGKIDGCGPKPSLLQPGAQLLCTLFRLRPEYEILETDLPGAHKTYRVTCRLFLTGAIPAIPVGEGVGEASSMESRHRFRNAAAEVIDTGEEVPKAFWSMRNNQGPEAAAKWLATAYDGKKMGTKKVDGIWHVVEYVGGDAGKIENPNPTDVHNTVLKMAKKRAFVDASITATASNDFFTQDLEDIRENLAAVDIVGEVVKKPAGAEKPAKGAEAPAKTEKRQEQPADGEETGKIGDWRNVVVHFGKPDEPGGKVGKILGRKLGELSESRLEWLLENANGKSEAKLSKDDRRLKAALALWKAEKTTGQTLTPGKPEGEAKPAGEANEERSANLNSLAENLDYAAVETELFLRTARGQKWTQAKTFDAITLEEAKWMVDNIENVLENCALEKKGAA